MKTTHRIAALLVAGVCQGTWAFGQSRGNAVAPQPKAAAQAAVGEGEPHANTSALALQDFKKRIDHYVALSKKEAAAAPALEQTNDPSEISAAEHAIAARIRTARATARPGDIFTPEIQVELKKLIAQPTRNDPDAKADAKFTVKEDAPASVPLKVNADYPEGAALPTVPASLLKNLPTLPEELEFRIIAGHLILRDVKANLIVDFIPNAMR